MFRPAFLLFKGLRHSADLLLGLVTQTLNDLYFSVEARTVRWSHEVVVKGALTAMVGALGAALVPAWEACRAPPAGIMLAIIFMNVFAPLIDHYVMKANIRRREVRLGLQ